MSKLLNFKSYVIRWYAKAHGLTGAETMDLFKPKGIIEYLDEFYDILHTQSLEFVVDDIDDLLNGRPAHRF